jgi:hypothetical protein
MRWFRLTVGLVLSVIVMTLTLSAFAGHHSHSGAIGDPAKCRIDGRNYHADGGWPNLWAFTRDISTNISWGGGGCYRIAVGVWSAATGAMYWSYSYDLYVQRGIDWHTQHCSRHRAQPSEWQNTWISFMLDSCP